MYDLGSPADICQGLQIRNIVWASWGILHTHQNIKCWNFVSLFLFPLITRLTWTRSFPLCMANWSSSITLILKDNPNMRVLTLALSLVIMGFMIWQGPAQPEKTSQTKRPAWTCTRHIALRGMSIFLGMGRVVLMFTFHRHYLWCSKHIFPLLSSIRHQVLRDPRPSFPHILLLWNQNKGFFSMGL